VNPRAASELVFLGAVWGASYLFTPIAGPEFGVISLVGLRILIAGVVLLPLLRRPGQLAIVRQYWLSILVAGLLNTGIPFLLLAYAAVHAGGGLASILNSTAALFGAGIAWAWLGRRLTLLQSSGLLMGVAGVTLLVWDELTIKSRASAGSGASAGVWASIIPVLAGLLGAACYGFTTNFTEKYLKAVPSATLTASSQVAVGLLMLPLTILFWPATMPSALAWGSAAALGILCTGIAFIVFYDVMGRIGGHKAMTVAFLIPMFGVFWNWLFRSEPVTWIMAGGGVMVILGLACTLGFIGPRRPA
jgi:drug/metabolite transporter (DMT)-like permease